MGNLWLVKCYGLILQPMTHTNYKFPVVGEKVMVCVGHRLQYQFTKLIVQHLRILNATEICCKLL